MKPMLRQARWVRLAALLVAMLAYAASVQAYTVMVPHDCAAPEDLSAPDEPLTRVAAAIAAGGPLNVLAIGSATTVGEQGHTAGGTAPGASFPYRMAESLRTALAGITVELTVQGGRGLTAEAMLPLLQEALKHQTYHLVLWQTGTVEAVRGLRPDSLLTVLQEGIEQVQQAGADLVLVDSQFSRFLRANADLDPYETVMQQVAVIPGVVLFHRFELMRSWASEGRIDLERTRKPDREKTIALLNTCLGATLARFVLNGAALQ